MSTKNPTMEPAPAASVADAAGLLVRELEDRLILAIKACEADIEKASIDLQRMKTALISLQQGAENLTGDIRPQRKTPLQRSIPQRLETGVPRDLLGSAASTIRAFVRAELRKAGHPLNRSEILDRLIKEGVSIDVAVPIKRIAKVMWSSPEFVNGGDGYWFAGEPIPRRLDDKGSRE